MVNKSKQEQIRMSHFLDYFKGSAGVNDRNKNTYSRALKFEQMCKIYNSDLITIRKISAIHKLFKSYDQLMETYSDLETYQTNPEVAPYYKTLTEIGEFYKKCEEKGLIEISEELLAIEKAGYFEDYNRSKAIIEAYLKYNESPYTVHFLKNAGINEASFERAIEVIKELDQDLYDDYLQKTYFNQGSRIMEVAPRLANIKAGIETGKTVDGETFDRLEFYKNFPFYEIDLAKEVLSDFQTRNAAYIDQKYKSLIQKVFPDESYGLLKYVYDNRLLTGQTLPISERDITKTKYTVNGREVTDNEKEMIINYMKNNRVAWLVVAFNEVRDRHLAGTLDLVTGKKLVKKENKDKKEKKEE